MQKLQNRATRIITRADQIIRSIEFSKVVLLRRKRKKALVNYDV